MLCSRNTQASTPVNNKAAAVDVWRTARLSLCTTMHQRHKQQTHAAATTGPFLTADCGLPCQQHKEQQCVCGVVIVDHGSRRAASNDMLVEFCQLYQQLTQHPIVEPAHMEIAEPTIAQAVGRCVAAGASRVVVAPYFLSRGRHIQEDIPALVAAAQEQYPHVQCSVAEPIGIDPLMVQLIQSRVTAVLSKDCPAVAAPVTVIVGATVAGS